MFPYGMNRNPDGSWTFFNREYKPVGTVADDWAEWDDPRHKIFLDKLTPAKMAKLDHKGIGLNGTDRIYFYEDSSYPERSSAAMAAYLEKLKILMGLEQRPR